MEELKTLKDYIKIKKQLENREILYEEILDVISDELGVSINQRN